MSSVMSVQQQDNFFQQSSNCYAQRFRQNWYGPSYRSSPLQLKLNQKVEKKIKKQKSQIHKQKQTKKQRKLNKRLQKQLKKREQLSLNQYFQNINQPLPPAGETQKKKNNDRKNMKRRITRKTSIFLLDIFSNLRQQYEKLEEKYCKFNHIKNDQKSKESMRQTQKYFFTICSTLPLISKDLFKQDQAFYLSNKCNPNSLFVRFAIEVTNLQEKNQHQLNQMCRKYSQQLIDYQKNPKKRQKNQQSNLRKELNQLNDQQHKSMKQYCQQMFKIFYYVSLQEDLQRGLQIMLGATLKWLQENQDPKFKIERSNSNNVIQICEFIQNLQKGHNAGDLKLLIENRIDKNKNNQSISKNNKSLNKSRKNIGFKQ